MIARGVNDVQRDTRRQIRIRTSNNNYNQCHGPTDVVPEPTAECSGLAELLGDRPGATRSMLFAVATMGHLQYGARKAMPSSGSHPLSHCRVAIYSNIVALLSICCQTQSRKCRNNHNEMILQELNIHG